MMASVEIGTRPRLRCTNYNDSLAESALLVERWTIEYIQLLDF